MNKDEQHTDKDENPHDPMQRVIDWQLAGIWAVDKTCRIKQKKENKLYISPSVSKSGNAIDQKKNLEDRLLGAIEWSNLRRQRNWKIFRMYLDGYKMHEIANFHGLTEGRVSQIIRKITG